ncbi:zinc-binding dehydrogenase [Lacticaseibacillus mingshuiensis]|uniref:Zinc-binding dehydrogenase n=1 Tax=Lacticaseibacillus mingshuiensis TaxID=2799574 RepID=A0ABW4CJM8_9LACO|nr:zinc-binding dehydrogenase [Lacticaseibacillus mingshuiensis]
MKAIVITNAGEPEALQLKDVPTPTVKPGWSLVQIKGFGINRSEIFTRNGWSPSVNFPRILGIEGVGLIAATSDPAHLPVGQKVISLMGGMGRDFDGSYAEYALLPNKQLYPVQTDLPWPELAAIPETYFTAYGSLLNLKITQAKTLLVRAATSGVGVAALKLAKAMNPGIVVTGSTRKPEKLARVREVGFDDAILETAGQLATDGHFDAILELVGPKTLMNSLPLLTVGGICCMTGELGGEWTVPDFEVFSIPSGAYLTNFSSDSANAENVQAMLDVITAHHIDTTPTKVFDLAHTGEAQAFLDSQESFGKVVVLP